ncbi:extracellular solute-binding protein [Herbivorax sp. ANBcel31]|uniref:extracellular solute-binding protein n=1 Tax=Herbivorax sp. ANBcel31 TaxID=3069754 RepID=UPI0027B5EC17|nr:extracellular solute-binding protein [Herbivorax sp. ANBcel31]MDQ2087722.1 extracellular solute-binding protein [Herbivorax sp. ANBcel31]
MLKKLISFLLIGILIFSFVACESDNEMENDEDSGEDSLKIEEDTTLEVWIMPNSERPQKDFMDLINPFLSENSHIEVNTTVIDWNQAFSKITDVCSRGEMPDVIQLDMEWVAAISSLDTLFDMSDMVDTDTFIEASLQTTGIKGEEAMTAMPWFLETKALFYRKDACEKAEVDPEKDFATWNSFKESLKKLNKLEIEDKELPALGEPGGNDLKVTDNFSWWIYSAGGSFLNYNGTKSDFNSSEALEGIKFYTELALEGLIDETSLEKNYEEVEKMFIEGEYATAFLDSSVINKLEKLVDEEGEDDEDDEENGEGSLIENIGVAMVPAGSEGRVSFLGGSSLAISKSSENIDAAIELLNYLSSEEAQLEYAKVTGKMPVSEDAYDDFFTEHPMRRVFKEQMEYAKAYPSVPEWGPVKTCLNDAFKRIWDNVINDEYSAYNFGITRNIVEETEELINNVVFGYENIEESLE